MFQARAKYLLIGAVVLLALGASVPQANAHWGWGWGWGYAPSYSSCCASYSCCDYGCGGWYAGVRPGPIRRALFGPYRWYYGGYCGGYCGWGCCTTCYCDPCCCWDVGCSDCGGGVVVQTPTVQQPTPAPSPAPAPAPATTPAPPKAGTSPMPGPGKLPGDLDAPPAGTGTIHLQSYVRVDNRSNSGMLTIYVPHDATVTVNGRLTNSTGSERSYVSFGLTPGYRYKYEIQAEIVRDGRRVQEAKTVYLTAGANEGVAFGFAKPIEGLAAAE